MPSHQKGFKMVSEDQAKQLHDRATRGELLSSEEYALLEEWYTLQDDDEHKTLGSTPNEKNLEILHVQVETLLTRLTTVTRHIQEISAENDSLKQEIARLYRQLQETAQPAG